MVDGAENNPPSFFTSRHYEVAKFYSLDEHTRIPDLVIFSQRIWEALAPQAQAWIRQAAAESVEFQRKLWIEKTAEALTAVEKAGVKISRPDKQPFVDAVAPLLREFEGTRVGDLANQIRAVR
jgi:TRAP-type C4-dicarboxylate transport system substrate-binding protein